MKKLNNSQYFRFLHIREEFAGNKAPAMAYSRGYVLTKSRALILLAIFLGTLIAVGLLVYFLADRPPPASAASELLNSLNANVTSPTAKPKVSINYRLPRTILPHHYDIRLLPIIEVGNFSILGHVSINVECKEETDRIVLHSNDVIVDAASVQVLDKTNNETLAVEEIQYDTEVEFLIITMSMKKSKLTKGHTYILTMSFIANLNDELRGFYRSRYTENGVEK